MNAQRCSLPEIEVSLENLGDACRAILHTIILCRALGEITPRAGECKNYPTLCYAKSGNADVDVEVENFVDCVKHDYARKPIGPDLSRIDIVLSFYEKREKKSGFLLGLVPMSSTQERAYWEHWLIRIVVSTRAGGEDIMREEEGIRSILFKIATLVNQRGDHVPHPQTQPGAAFPFEIRLANENSDITKSNPETSWFTSMIQQAKPPSLG